MWKTINYEVCGRGHVKTNTACQDKTYTLHENNVFVIALADGAGSAQYSEYGAEVAITVTAKYITTNFDQIISTLDGVKVKEAIVEHAYSALCIESQRMKCHIKELASTLLVVAVKDDDFFICHLGDGVIGYVKYGELKVISTPQNGEFVNSTVFLTSQTAVNSLKIFKGKSSGVSGFVIMSDGTAESFYYKKSSSLSPAIKKIITWAIFLPESKIREMLIRNFKYLIIQNTLDDCSIAFLIKEYPKANFYFNLSDRSKCDLLGIKYKYSKVTKKQIQQVDGILGYLSICPHCLNTLAKKTHVKKKYLRKRLKKLEYLGLVEHNNAQFYSNLTD